MKFLLMIVPRPLMMSGSIGLAEPNLNKDSFKASSPFPLTVLSIKF